VKLALWILLLFTPLAAVAHPAMEGKACVDCHPDQHHGEFAQRSCGDCHTTTKFAPSRMDAALHSSITKYVLDGKHVATPCSGCHVGPRPKTSFLVPSAECLDCHTNPHGQEFAGRKETGCADCHTTSAWKTWKVDHASWKLEGAHQRMACVGCHPGKTLDAPIASYRGIAKTCDGCHRDTHASQFGKQACSACHGVERWRSTTNFDHAKAKYALEGAHVQLACATCHAPTTLRNGDVAVRWKLGYAECKDCHANPHPKVAMDCKGCHGGTTWKPNGGGPAGFDHDATGFVLKQAHAKAPCTQCHDGKPRPAGARTNATCQSCHPDPHMGRMAGQCFECHTAVAWQDTNAFEQHRRTRMPLTGKHAVIECVACHKRQGERPWRDIATDCFGCHAAGYRRADNHDGTTGAGETKPRECQLCHVTATWTPALRLTDITRNAEHDRVFVLTTGSHRSASCDQCHVDRTRSRAVRCDGCHQMATLKTQHREPVAAVAQTCLRCHPRGVRR